MRFHLVSGCELALMKAGEWVWSVTRECGHEKVHALVVSLRTKRRKKKKTEREERRRRKVGLTHVRKQKAREESKLRHHRQLSVTAALVD